jgi:hypothetical protein
MPPKTPPLHVLRGILRLSKSPPLPKELASKGAPAAAVATSSTSNNATNAIQRFVLDRYRQHQSETCPKTRALLQDMSLNYFHMKQDLVERGRLYNLDTGAENQLSGTEMSRRAAARSGLQMPKINPELE